ncbi:glycosyltransferase family 2 protein [Insulibacter thermoxylanivorax]|uniref:glycosyltransferase family 2 protein n=1 Tax=Insulibacter thermoxylanivorax TaxID=2749268 RepID=UPI001F5B254D|nr:glycosyltransferase [Insulibacter thermoxylanivorax]
MAPSKLRRRRKGTSSGQRRVRSLVRRSTARKMRISHPLLAGPPAGRDSGRKLRIGMRGTDRMGKGRLTSKVRRVGGARRYSRTGKTRKNRCGQAWFAARRKHAAGSIREAARRPRRAGQTLCMGTSHKLRFRRSIAAVVTCKDEQYTLPAVLRELRRLPLQEILVIINGSTDRSLEQALKFSRITIVWCPEALGHDVGRALGARLTTSDTVLFLDGDLPIRAERLVPFLHAVERGADLALNDLSPYIGRFAEQDHVTRFKTFLNRVLGRRDLKMNSMTAVPHAVSRRLITGIGAENFAVPPKAQALAIMEGYKVTAPASIDVIKHNRVRPHNTGEFNLVANLIIGDYLEAIHEVIQRRGARGAYPDGERKRELAWGDVDAYEYRDTVV